jgi:autotransporter-associated beta strand protein
MMKTRLQPISNLMKTRLQPISNPAALARALASLAALAALAALTTGTAQAATSYTWDGGPSAANNNFSTAANWNGSVPTTINDHYFIFGPLASGGNTTANIDLTGNLRTFTFASGLAPMTITGNDLQFGPAATGTVILNNSSSLQTINNYVKVFKNVTFDAANGDLALGNSTLDWRNDLLAAGGSLTLTLQGSQNGTISGNLNVANGTASQYNILKTGGGTWTLANGGSVNNVSLVQGTLKRTGGTLAVTGNLGSTATTHAGALEVTGGTTTVSGNLVVGWNAAPAFTVSGGSLTAATIYHQDAGTATLNIGGTVVSSGGNVYHTTNGTGTDSFTLNLNSGGSLTASSLFMSLGTNAQANGNHSLTVNFDGGTLKAGATAANLIAATPTGGASTRAINVNVKAGGAVIDTNGFDATIQRPLLHDSALGASPDGGLSKTGAGTLTLTGVNDYTGKTTIHTGTLKLASTGSIANSTDIKVANAATFDVSAVSGGFVLGSGKSIGGDGALTGDVTFNDTSIFSWSLSVTDPSNTGSANTGDTFAVSGALADGGSAGGSVFKIILDGSQTFAGAFWNTAHSWSDVLFAGSGVSDLSTLFTSFDYANASGTISGPSNGSFSLSGTTLSYSLIPEPTTALAGLLLGAGLLRRRRCC